MVRTQRKQSREGDWTIEAKSMCLVRATWLWRSWMRERTGPENGKEGDRVREREREGERDC